MNNETTIIFINGVPGSGKDEFINQLKQFHGNGVQTISAIHCIEKLLGIPSSDKSPEARRVKADVGTSLEIYNHYKSKNTALAALNLIEIQTPTLLFVHARDVLVINRIEDYMRQFARQDLKLNFMRVIMHRPQMMKPASEYSNEPDREALELTRQFLRYDYVQLVPTMMYSVVHGRSHILIDNSHATLDPLIATSVEFLGVLNNLFKSEAA